ncbi:MAG TPA: hypothetical protein VGK73_23080 [Polyangiaceae bacterium]
MSVEYGEHGRWGGRLTRRPLPERDPAIAALPARARRRLAEIWLYRAAMERRVADSFQVIRGALERRGASGELLALAARAVDDEYRHTELSRVVASRFEGHELALPERLPLELPSHASASPELRDTLHVVGQCVLNETTAGAYLEVCLTHASGALARAALQELLSDEIDHGRIGWAHLASVDSATRAAVGPWILPMAYLNLRSWMGQTPDDPEQSDVLGAHGAPPASAIRAALRQVIGDLVVPGLEELGMNATPLARWLAAGAFTDRPPRELAEQWDNRGTTRPGLPVG